MIIIDRAIFKYIEREMYDYEETKKMIKTLEDDIIYDSAVSYSGVPSGKTNNISKVTERKVIDLTTNAQLNKAKRTVQAIDKAKIRMNEEELWLYDLQYNQGIHFKKIISSYIIMSERSYRRKRNKIVAKVAEEMGFAV